MYSQTERSVPEQRSTPTDPSPPSELRRAGAVRRSRAVSFLPWRHFAVAVEVTDHAAGFRVTVLASRPGTVRRMLVVRVELWPGGDAERVHELGRLGIANVSGLAPVSD